MKYTNLIKVIISACYEVNSYMADHLEFSILELLEEDDQLLGVLKLGTYKFTFRYKHTALDAPYGDLLCITYNKVEYGYSLIENKEANSYSLLALTKNTSHSEYIISDLYHGIIKIRHTDLNITQICHSYIRWFNKREGSIVQVAMTPYRRQRIAVASNPIYSVGLIVTSQNKHSEEVITWEDTVVCHAHFESLLVAKRCNEIDIVTIRQLAEKVPSYSKENLFTVQDCFVKRTGNKFDVLSSNGPFLELTQIDSQNFEDHETHYNFDSEPFLHLTCK